MSRRVPLHDTRSPMDDPTDVPPLTLRELCIGLALIGAGLALALFVILALHGSVNYR